MVYGVWLIVLVFLHKAAIECADTSDLLPSVLVEFRTDYFYDTSCGDGSYLSASAYIKAVSESMEESSGEVISCAGRVGTAGGDGSDMMPFAALLDVRTVLTDFDDSDVTLLCDHLNGFFRIEMRVGKRLIFVGKDDIDILLKSS